MNETVVLSIGNLALKKKKLLYLTLEKWHAGMSYYPNLFPLVADIYFEGQILDTSKNISVKLELKL